MNTKVPYTIGRLHFVGIGGIGMSGIAGVLHSMGYHVSGSDVAISPNVERLRKQGIHVAIGHEPENVSKAGVVIISSAVKDSNPELLSARAQQIPIVKRAEMLAELMRLKRTIAVAGTHGKTTTTSLIAHIMVTLGQDPTIVNGGIINARGSNAWVGSGDWLVAEADESDGTFLKLPTDVAVVTNIDPEHLDHFETFEREVAAFHQFVESIPFYGQAVLCMDHPQVQALIAKITDRRVISYGLSAQAMVQASNLAVLPEGGQSFDLRLSIPGESERNYLGVKLSLNGRHNVLNALAAFAAVRATGQADDGIIKALASFSGVKRRFTRTGTALGATIIDDYAHHPEEIKAVLETARQVSQAKVIAVMQPHRYTRVRDLFQGFCSCFNQADMVMIAPIYAAGEAAIEGVSHENLAEGLRRFGHRNVMTIASEADLVLNLKPLLHNGDIVVCMGAGSITQWAANLPEKLGGKSASQEPKH